MVPVEQQFEKLMQKIAPQAKLLRVWPLAGGISAQMNAVELQHPDGHIEKMIVRQFSQHTIQSDSLAAQNQFKLLQTIQVLGLATPKPIYFDPASNLLGAPCLVIEYIPGKIDFAPSNLQSSMHQFACQLSKIHNITAANVDLSFLYRRSNRCVEMSKVGNGRINATMQESRIRSVLSSVGKLTRENTAVLLHGDYWPGNVLWQDDTLVAVIDWEDATVGDPLIDLAISRLDLVWIFGIDAMQRFTQVYQFQMDIDYTNLPFWDLCAALRLIRLAGADLASWVGFFERYGRFDITVESFLTNYQYFINQAFEKLAHVSQ